MQTIKKENTDIIIFDFDGVMTDNRVTVDENGKESVTVSRADGLGVSMIKQKGIKMLILSTETNNVVAKRAEKLALPVVHGVGDKSSVLVKYFADNGVDGSRAVYIGNDINDLEAMKLCGVVIVPADAYPCVKKVADIVLETKGGYGVVRELADIID